MSIKIPEGLSPAETQSWLREIILMAIIASPRRVASVEAGHDLLAKVIAAATVSKDEVFFEASAADPATAVADKIATHPYLFAADTQADVGQEAKTQQEEKRDQTDWRDRRITTGPYAGRRLGDLSAVEKNDHANHEAAAQRASVDSPEASVAWGKLTAEGKLRRGNGEHGSVKL